MPRNNKKRSNQNQNNNQNVNFHKNNGIHKKHFNKGQFNNKKYIASHLINDDLDVDLDRNNDNRNQNTNNHNNNNRYNNNYRKDNQSKRKVFERIEKMAVVSKETAKKLSIGDDDSGKKSLLSSTPHCKPAHVPDEVFSVIVKFLQDYFTCYDTNRDNLLAAYNPKVLFSLSVNASNSGAHRVFKFDDYIKESRNLRRVFATDDYSLEKRFKLLHQGHIDTVNCLRKLPSSEHDPATFKLDQVFFTPHMVTFTVVGVFKEGKATDKVRPMRSFQRTFVCIPDANTCMSIINEVYIISNMSVQQHRNFFKDKTTEQRKMTNGSTTSEAATTSSVASTSAAIAPVQLNELPVNLTEQQKQMVEQFSAQTNLTLVWSHDCLQNTTWNYETAAQLFMQYSSQIPPEAFKKP